MSRLEHWGTWGGVEYYIDNECPYGTWFVPPSYTDELLIIDRWKEFCESIKPYWRKRGNHE